MRATLLILLLVTTVVLYQFLKLNNKVALECFKEHKGMRPMYQDVLYGYKVAFDMSGSGIMQQPHQMVQPQFQPHQMVQPQFQPHQMVQPRFPPQQLIQPNFQPQLPRVQPAPVPQPVVQPAPVPQPAVQPVPVPQPAVQPVPVPQPAVQPAPVPQPVVQPAPVPGLPQGAPPEAAPQKQPSVVAADTSVDSDTYDGTVNETAVKEANLLGVPDRKTLETQHFVVVYSPKMWSQDQSELLLTGKNNLADWEAWIGVFLEKAWSVLVHTLGFPKPHNSAIDPTKKNFKITIAIDDKEAVTTSYGAAVSAFVNSSLDGLSYVVFSRKYILDEWIVMHELGHVIMFYACDCSCSWQGQCLGETETGIMRESLAAWIALEYFAVQKDNNPGAQMLYSEFVNARWANRHAFLGSPKTRYGDFFFFYYLQRDPDSLGFSRNLMSSILTDRLPNEPRWSVIMRKVNETKSDLTMAQLFGYYYRRFALFDFPHVSTPFLDELHRWCKGNTVNRKRLNSMKVQGDSVVDEDAKPAYPQHGGYNIVTLKPTGAEIKLTITQKSNVGELTASLFRYDSANRTAVYSALVGSGKPCTIAVDGSEASWYGFTVSGALESNMPIHSDTPSSLVTGSEVDMPYAIEIEGAVPELFDVPG